MSEMPVSLLTICRSLKVYTYMSEGSFMSAYLLARKCRPLKLSLPKIEGPSDILKAVNAVQVAVSTGRITVDEGDGLLRTVEAARKALETEELRREIDALETRLEMLVTPKMRLSKFRKRLAIPREFYIAAVKRQEERRRLT
jgi:hypothetical protein